MNPVGVLVGVLVSAGLLLIVHALTDRGTDEQASGPGRARRTPPLWRRLTRRQLALYAGAVLAGLILARTTGWAIAVLVLPLLAWGAPKVLTPPDTTRTDLLEALEQWTRRLAALIQTGHHLTETLTASLRSCPAPIRPAVDLFVARLQARQRPQDALYAFANDLNDETGDLIAAALIRGSTESGAPLAAILSDLADMVAHEVRMRRQITIAQRGPRSELRWAALIGAASLAAVLLMPYGAFYKTPVGQLILLGLFAGVAAVLAWMRAIAAPPATVRFLTRAPGPGLRS